MMATEYKYNIFTPTFYTLLVQISIRVRPAELEIVLCWSCLAVLWAPYLEHIPDSLIFIILSLFYFSESESSISKFYVCLLVQFTQNTWFRDLSCIHLILELL